MNSRIWSRDFADGRSSVAMLNLLSELRNLRQRGANLKIVAVQPAGNFQLLSQDYYEIAFAANIVRAATTEPNALVVALLGSVHARKTPLEGVDGLHPAMSVLPRQNSVTLQYRNEGGSAWNCRGAICKEHPCPDAKPGKRGVILTPGDDAADGYFSTGAPVTASPPAIEAKP